ncbi:hypothetical protein [Clostridioides difficile]|uniref:hypothetical protein n=1 Tax=Clostridioides difficile TaxID=1496 RepID=UPI0014419AC9|nr:hypothetical protein [Clostridioides difficile]NKN22150.1 hypothetical protein [Clostridioides difficile]
MNKFQLDEAIRITQKDKKELNAYSNDIKECKKVKVTIVKKMEPKCLLPFLMNYYMTF